jgi:tRNA A-37 threonylcarbamoyl transferase component Bud32
MEERGCSWRVNARLFTPALLARLRNPDTLLAPPAVPVRAESPRRVTFVVRAAWPEVPGQRVVVKRYRPTRLQAAKACFRESRAWHAFDVALRLQDLGIPTACPVAAGERRRGRWLREAFLITLEVPEAADFGAARAGAGRSPGARRLVRSLGRLLPKLHEAGLHPTDLRQSNLLVRSGARDTLELVLIDLDGVRLCRRLSARLAQRNLHALLRRVPLTPRERLWLLAEYCRGRSSRWNVRDLAQALSLFVGTRRLRPGETPPAPALL